MARRKNLVHLLFDRELGGGLRGRRVTASVSGKDRESGLHEWATRDSLRHCSSECCSLNSAEPRSTIAVAISRDGYLSASTHGDHTVKIIEFNTGKFVRALEGHHRTPWTVRFHPLKSSLVVSGSLDYEVRVWDINTGECLQSKDFGRPISSLCFDSTGSVLAIAAGHKLHVWEYDEDSGRFTESSVVLKTSKTIRTVHFHPLGASMIVTTERIEPQTIRDSADDGADSGTASGSESAGPAPWCFGGGGIGFTGQNPHHVHPANVPFPYGQMYFGGYGDSSASQGILSLGARSSGSETSSGNWTFPVPTQPQHPPQHPPQHSHSQPLPHQGYAETGVRGEEEVASSQILNHYGQFGQEPGPRRHGSGDFFPAMHHRSSGGGGFRSRRYNSIGASDFVPRRYNEGGGHRRHWGRGGHHHPAHRNQSADEMAIRRDRWDNRTLSLSGERLPPDGASSSHPRSWPGQRSSHAHGWRQHRMSGNGYTGNGFRPAAQNEPPPIAEVPLVNAMPIGGMQGLNGQDGLPDIELRRTDGPSQLPIIGNAAITQIGRIFQTMPGYSQELPCTTRLVLWRFDKDNPHQELTEPLLQIPGTVLCSEMGAHISPCGRLLAVCTANLNPQDCQQSYMSPEVQSPQYSYELKVISLEQDTFGEVVRSRLISAGHCLTSVQFSPGSDMILLSYGRKHVSLVRSLVSRGQTVGQIHTLLEVYRASDLALVRVLHSIEDEANTACFHPFAGEGILYGTKGGKLRILRHTRSHSSDSEDFDSSKLEDELLEVGELEDSNALGIEN